MFFEIIIFILYTLFCFSSVIGYGLVFNKIFFKSSEVNLGEIGLFGFLFLFFLSILIHFFIPLSYWLNFFILFLGFFSILFKIKYIYSELLKIKTNIILITLIVLTSILIHHTHGDHEWYHLMYVNYLNNFKIVFGLVNIQNSLAHGHGWMDIMGLFSLPIVENKGVSIIALIFFYFFLLYLLIEIKTTKIKSVKIFSIIVIVFSFATYNKLADFGAEIQPSLIIIILILNIIKILENKNIDEMLMKIIFYAFYAVVLRIGSIIILPILFFILLLNYTSVLKLFYKYLRLYFFLAMFFIIFLVKNFIISGCLYFPIYQTCFDNNKITWAVPIEEARERYEFLRAISHRWHFYVIEEANLEKREDYYEPMSEGKILDPRSYNKKTFFWLKYWSKDPDNAKLLNSILIILFCFFCFFIFSKKKSNLIKSLNFVSKKNNLIHLGLISSVLMWFFLSPSMRYGGYPIVGGTLIFYFSLILSNNLIVKKNFNFIAIFLIFLSTSYFSIKNIARILNKIDEKKFTNFPWPQYKNNLKDIDYKTIEINNTKLNLMLTSDNMVNGENIGPVICGNVDMLCMPADRIVCVSNIYKKNKYIFINNKNPECLSQIRKHYWQ